MPSHSNTPAIESDSSIDTSIRGMMLKKLPQELFDLIEKYFYELTFLPGYIYPLGKPPGLHEDPTGTEAEAWNRRGKVNGSLLCLSKDINSRYRERIYSENTVVWGSGQDPPGYSYICGFQGGRMPTSIEVVFGPGDRGNESVQVFREHEENNRRQWGGSPSETPRTERERKAVAVQELLCAWRTKFLYCGLSKFPLDELTLDFRQCYDADGNWLGTSDGFVKRLITGCEYKPHRITVLAPDAEKKEEIWRIIREVHGKNLLD
ncbi:MAG: hypothetical protein Q9168_003790 [Polycauliona sp. 1 TL-2023]